MNFHISFERIDKGEKRERKRKEKGREKRKGQKRERKRKEKREAPSISKEPLAAAVGFRIYFFKPGCLRLHTRYLRIHTRCLRSTCSNHRCL